MMMTLPPEILGHCFRNLEKPTLFNVRLVSKSFEEAASPFLFDQVYISSFRTDLEVANLTVLRFGRYVRTLVFASHYLNYALDEFRWSLRQKFYSDDINPPESFNLHLENACDRYIGRYAEWRDVNRSGELLDRLCFFLGKMPRLETIKIGTSPPFGYHSRESLSFPETESASSRPVRILYNEALKPHFLPHLYVSIAYVTSAWRSLMHALSITKIYVKQIALHNPRGILPTSYEAFEMLQAQDLDLGESFRCLTTLRLTLGGWEKESTRDAAGILEDLANVLAAASNLSQLQLDGNYGIGSPLFETIFTGCRFPKLNSLDLSYISLTEEQLVGLLGSSPGLQTLVLYQVFLRQGLWERVVRWIKQSLQLHSVNFEELLGGEPHPFVGDEAAFVDPNDVKDFILRNGENPYTKGALEQIMSRQALLEDVSI